jgi:hypothetical protein
MEATSPGTARARSAVSAGTYRSSRPFRKSPILLPKWLTTVWVDTPACFATSARVTSSNQALPNRVTAESRMASRVASTALVRADISYWRGIGPPVALYLTQMN